MVFKYQHKTLEGTGVHECAVDFQVRRSENLLPTRCK
jgi:hypothetical protein